MKYVLQDYFLLCLFPVYHSSLKNLSRYGRNILVLLTRDLALFRKMKSNALPAEILLALQVLFIKKEKEKRKHAQLCYRHLKVILFIPKNDK